MNYKEVAFDSNGRAVMWQDVSGRLYAYIGNDFVEVDQYGRPIGNNANQDLQPIELDSFGQPVRWQNRTGRTYVLDRYGNLQEEVARPMTNSVGNGYSNGYSGPVNPNAGNYKRPGQAAEQSTSMYVSDRFKQTEVKETAKPAHNQPPVNVKPAVTSKPISLLTFKGKPSPYRPLVDEAIYDVTINVDKESKTYGFTIKDKGV